MSLKRHNPLAVLQLLTVFLLASIVGYSQQARTVDALKTYLQQNQAKNKLASAEFNDLVVTHEYIDESTGINHVYATQRLNGLTITNSSFSLHSIGNNKVDANKLVRFSSYAVGSAGAAITAKDAVASAFKEVGYKGPSDLNVKQAEQGTDKVIIFSRNAAKIWDVAARLVYYNNERLKTLTSAWEVQFLDADKRHFWLTYVDASTSKVLEKRDLIKHCTFGGLPTDIRAAEKTSALNNFKENSTANDPVIGARAAALPANKYRVIDMPFESPIDPGASLSISSKSGDTLASPDGWHRVNASVTYNYTHGNNVWAFQDPSPGPLGGVPSADPTRTSYPTNTTAGIPPAVEPFVFDYPANGNNQPETYMKAAIVNLFYWNNLVHDVFYYLGFTEAAGNFEESHVFSTGARTGGASGDEVLAQAQDGGGTNNANFLALPDGTNGQMQMYLWTTATPDSLVQIVTSSTGNPPAGKKYIAIQGSLNSLPDSNNLYTRPVLNKQLVLVKKNALSTVGTDEEGCSTGQQSVALPPSNNVSGKIAVVRRGDCSFVEKVLGAQEGGAVGVIIVNNVAGGPMPFGGSDAPGNAVNIPAVMISKEDGDILIDQLKAGATITGSLKRNSPPQPKRDGDFDNGVISHEYGHGISNRLTGGPNAVTPLGGDEQGGEGWSDYIAMYMTLRTNDLNAATAGHPNGVLPTRSIGNYVTYQNYDGQGIREYPYSTDLSANPATFAYVKRSDYSETHSVGFVWCSMLYEFLQAFIDQYGMSNNVYEGANPTASKNPPASAKGNNIAMRLIIEGMKLQPTSPTFVEERDAILKADTLLYGAQHSCMIWKAFAKRGLGYSAVSGSNALGDEVEAFDVPLSCDTTQKRFKIVKTAPARVDNNNTATYTIKVTNRYAKAATGVVINDTLPAGLSYISGSPVPTVSGNVVKWTLNFAASQTRTLTLTTGVASPVASQLKFSENNEGATTSFTAMNQGGMDTWTLQNNAAQAYSGSKYWFVPDTDLGGSNTTLTSKTPVNIPAGAELVFIHKYASEETYDGGIVEVSEDGTNWTYLPPSKFVQNGYSSVIPTANTPTVGTADRAAFSGASEGYITSIAKLDDYTNKNLYFRFRFVSDPTGGSITNGGWWMDDAYILVNRVEVTNRANVITNPNSASVAGEGSNAYSTASSFVIGQGTLASGIGNLYAAASKNYVDLKWSASNEADVRGYDVERKAQGEEVFTKIGSVNAKNSGSVSNYNFRDERVNVAGRYQYRVKQLTATGQPFYTNIALVTLGGKVFAVNVYPNPAESVANISITNPAEGKVVLSLYDATGKKLSTFNGNTNASQLISLPVQGLKSGTYYLEVGAGEERTTLSFVKK